MSELIMLNAENVLTLPVGTICAVMDLQTRQLVELKLNANEALQVRIYFTTTLSRIDEFEEFGADDEYADYIQHLRPLPIETEFGIIATAVHTREEFGEMLKTEQYTIS
jgi:hypothetical protein